MTRTASTAVSLFCSGGIADLALRTAGFEVLVASELVLERAEVYKANFTSTEVIIGDIRKTKKEVVHRARARLGGRTLDLLFATPPCQGMSKNGRGKLLSEIRAGLRPQFDPRNQLITDTLEIIRELRPQNILFENVPEMLTTIIEDMDGTPISMMDYIRREMPTEYSGASTVVEFADFGVPQRRQRLITVYTRCPEFRLAINRDSHQAFPTRTHSRQASLLEKPWVTVDDTICGLPPLDAASSEAASSEIPFHRVPLLDQEKYFWVSNTPPGKGAFDNQCANPSCLFGENVGHGSSYDQKGINRSHKSTPIRCLRCGELLPRPWVRQADEYRLMSGYTSAYKRMRGDLPASALTRNLSYACSDQKLSPLSKQSTFPEGSVSITHDYGLPLELAESGRQAGFRQVDPRNSR